EPAEAAGLIHAWASRLLSAGSNITPGSSPAAGPPAAPAPPPPATCGNFTADVCAAYTEIARTGKVSTATRELLESVSPKQVAHHIKVPTLLVQGEQDSLFGLDQADANARQIASSGAEVKVVWFAGGHDGQAPGQR